jgi:hypothetical protein
MRAVCARHTASSSLKLKRASHSAGTCSGQCAMCGSYCRYSGPRAGSCAEMAASTRSRNAYSTYVPLATKRAGPPASLALAVRLCAHRSVMAAPKLAHEDCASVWSQ